MTKAVAIDTNLLVLLVVGLTSSEYIRRHRRLHPTYKSRHFELVQGLLVRAPEVICTAHILAEASNLLRQIGDPMRSEIMAKYGMFIELADEPVIPAKQASRSPNFIRLGLTDAAILSLDPTDVLLLTVDHDLHIACSQRGFEVHNLVSYLYE